MTAPLWLLTLITFSGTLAMHIFVPALPEAARGLGASIGEMQLTMSVYIFGLAVGQLAYGPLSDRYGRRPVLVAGLVLYTLAGTAACFVGDVHHLIVARLFQALGGCAGMVIGRAMVRDTAGAQDSARRLATMNLMAGATPAWISRQMGHKNSQMFFTVYSKWIDGADKGKERSKIDTLFTQDSHKTATNQEKQG